MTTVFGLATTGESPTTTLPLIMHGGIAAMGTYQPVKYDSTNPLTGDAHGALNLDSALTQHYLATTVHDDMIVLAHGYGAVAAAYWLRHYGGTTPIPPNLLRLYLISNSVRHLTGKLISRYGEAPLFNAFHVDDIAIQYDALADYPNVTSATGYRAAINNVTKHPNYQQVYLNDEHEQHDASNTTYWLYPTAVTRGDQALIETAYNRP